MKRALRLLVLALLTLLALQLYFLLRIAAMNWIDPQSTTFQRSEMTRIVARDGRLAWSQQWVALSAISANLPRAVIASEDGGFLEHHGIEWEAVEQAWSKNQRAEARAAQRKNGRRVAKVVGGSTITQQLAKNLFLSGERSMARKAQEALLALSLEALLSKSRILEIYLNHVEWGEGVFGAQAAARHYFRVDARQLAAAQAARLAVMLPAPKRFERLPGSAYLATRSGTIQARMGDVELPPR
ncbi:monofunctional biosynthetic peptidoglycan transglycosylase [Pseudorhodoferax sp.]|uniref:monofunctional biosynthetic peptidoglycan transglycosylase n=1 Tax=Pseudorhodoferax sp. TaxID=1993553 RepID=UPI001B6ABDCF|nr:monofunctional biosynthetic peptidoglycan transglycosylase [Pseudorhodoferax sp.]MBP7660504.1 monofunctional biosynthetic peptidoglycan transglycosylase [Burkholderiaceae bacterium]